MISAVASEEHLLKSRSVFRRIDRQRSDIFPFIFSGIGRTWSYDHLDYDTESTSPFNPLLQISVCIAAKAILLSFSQV